MAVDIFSSALGAVYCMTVTGQTRIARLRVPDFPDSSVIVNSLGIDQSEAVHISQSIGGSARVVSLGTSPSQVKLAGIAPDSMVNCSSEASENGLANIMSFYAAKKVGTYGKPVTISYGELTFSAYVLGLSTSTGTDNGPLSSFSMTLLSLDSIDPKGLTT